MKIPTISIDTRATPITADNKSTAVTIATWLLTITFIIMFLSREAIKFVVLRKFQVDDLLILLATVFACGLSAATLILAANGLGVMEPVTIRRANVFMKGYYASDFLYVSSVCFAKLSLLAFFHGINIRNTYRRLVQVLGALIVAWTVASFAALAFQCDLPRPWEMLTLHCYNSGIFWMIYCIIDMTTDVAIIMLSVHLVAYLKVKTSRKVAVVACFAPRILVIGAALTRLVYLYPINPHTNPTFNLWVPVICTQIQVCLSISTACIPYMKPFFEGVEAGVWRVDDLRRRGLTPSGLYGYGSMGGYRKARSKEAYSMDSTFASSLKYGRTPDVSPQIPAPAPLSPLTPPRLATPSTPRKLTPPPNSRASSQRRSPSERGLKIQIPTRESRAEADVTSPQTASSVALSPNCLSPMTRPLISPALLPHSAPHSPSPTRPLPPIPTTAAGLRPLLLSPQRSSLNPNPAGPVRSPSPSGIVSAFPRPPSSHYTDRSKSRSPPPDFGEPYPPPMPPPRIARSHSRKRQRYPVAPNMSRPLQTIASETDLETTQPQPPLAFPPRTSSRKHPKYAITPRPYSNAPDSGSSTIPSYYTRTPPMPALPSMPTPPESVSQNSSPTSPQRIRNQRVLSPQNTSRWEQLSPYSPPMSLISPSPRTPLGFWKDEGGENDRRENKGLGIHRAADEAELFGHGRRPLIKDVRSSPKIVVRRPS